MGPLGRVCVAVEPDAEHFAVVAPHPPSTVGVGCQVKIDGNDLGWGKDVFPEQSMVLISSTKVENGVETTTSFRFEKPKKNDGRGRSAHLGMIMGCVTVTPLHQVIFQGHVKSFNAQSK